MNGFTEMNVMIDEWAFMPARAHAEDAGLDIRTPYCVVVQPHSSAVVDTGVHVQIPKGWYGELLSKSGLNVKHNITSTGVIDCGYTGGITVKLYNHGEQPYIFKRGDKISQLVLIPCALPALKQVDAFEETERGDNGFGSTGR